MNIGVKLKNARLKVNMTQEELSEKIYISRQSISSWENGRNFPDIVSVIILSELYNISLDELLKGDADMMKNLSNSSKVKKKLYLREKALSKSREAFIVDGLGNKEYFIEEVGFLLTPKYYHVKDKEGELFCKISRKRFQGLNLPRIHLNIKGYEKITLLIDIKYFSKYFNISGENLKIEGEWLSKKFDLLKGEKLIAKVSENRDTYEITVLEEEYEKLIVGFMIGLNLIHDNLNYNMK